MKKSTFKYAIDNYQKEIKFKFDDQSKKFIIKIINDERFVKELENIIRSFLISYRQQMEFRPGRKETKNILDKLQGQARELYDTLIYLPNTILVVLHFNEVLLGLAPNDNNLSSIMAAAKHTKLDNAFTAMGLMKRLENDLCLLNDLFDKTKFDMNINSKLLHKDITAPIWVCGEIKALLKKWNIKPTKYTGGAWCQLTELALGFANLNSGSLNYLRAWDRFESSTDGNTNVILHGVRKRLKVHPL